jgi:hypothetical protein
VSIALVARQAAWAADDLFRVGAGAVVFEAAREAVWVILERAGFGADLALAGLAGAFPVNACLLCSLA